MDPNKYAGILRKIELCNISMESCSAEINRKQIDLQKGSIIVDIKDRVAYQQEKGRLKVTHKYYLTAKTSKDSKEHVIKSKVAFLVVFDTKTEIYEDFFNVFKEINLPLNTWPYLREFVQNMTQRMNIPPLTLPFVKRS